MGSTGTLTPRTISSGNSRNQFPWWIVTLTDPGLDFGVGNAAIHCMFFEPHSQWKGLFS